MSSGWHTGQVVSLRTSSVEHGGYRVIALGKRVGYAYVGYALPFSRIAKPESWGVDQCRECKRFGYHATFCAELDFAPRQYI